MVISHHLWVRMSKKHNHIGTTKTPCRGPKLAKHNLIQEIRRGRCRPLDGLYQDAVARNLIACALAVSSTAFLVGAALYGWSVGDFSALKETWHALAPILAMMLAYYFSRQDAAP